MADFPTAAVDRLGEYNGARYDAQTNPFGFAIGGHRVNFPTSLSDTAVAVKYVGEAASEIAAFAQQTAADRVQTGQDRQAAAASAAAAATFDPALFAKLVGANFTGPVSTTKALAAGEGVRWGVSVVPSESDWNAVTVGGIYMAQNMANAPGGSATRFYVIVQRHDENHVSQTATNLFSGETFQRIRVGGTWGAWANLWSGATSPVATDAEADAGSVGAPRMWSPAQLRRGARAADPEVLVASYTGAQLNGLSQVVLDLPTGFSTFRLLIETVASANAGALTLRCGPAGGSLSTGASDYAVISHGQDGNSTIAVNATASEIGVGTTNNNGHTLIEVVLNDGSGGGFWRAKTSEIGPGSAAGTYRYCDRFGLFVGAAGARKRLAILTTQPFANSGSIKIYGVRP